MTSPIGYVPPRRRLRGQHRRSRTTITGVHAWSLGLRLGYWPCLRAPFVAIDIATHRFEVWYGDPSYLGRKDPIG